MYSVTKKDIMIFFILLNVFLFLLFVNRIFTFLKIIYLPISLGRKKKKGLSARRLLIQYNDTKKKKGSRLCVHILMAPRNMYYGRQSGKDGTRSTRGQLASQYPTQRLM